MDIFEWTEETPVTANNLNEMQNTINDNITAERNKMGKTLWEGSFTSGTISVPDISKYKLIAIYSGNLMMLGNQYYGGSAFATYQAYTTSYYWYRYTYNATNETLTTDNNNRGATNGTSSIAISKIVGVV